MRKFLPLPGTVCLVQKIHLSINTDISSVIDPLQMKHSGSEEVGLLMILTQYKILCILDVGLQYEYFNLKRVGK